METQRPPQPDVEKENKNKEIVTQRWEKTCQNLERAGIPEELLKRLVENVSYKPGEVSQEFKDRIGMDVQAVLDGKNIEIFDSFFKNKDGSDKSENVQTYTLNHEVSHALTMSSLFSDEDMKALSELGEDMPVDEETKYVRLLKGQVDSGKLTKQAYFLEQIAERLNIYLLGGGDLGKMLSIQFMYLDKPKQDEILGQIPEDVRLDEAKLSKYLVENPNGIPLIENTKKYWQIYEKALSEENITEYLENEDNPERELEYWPDGDSLGSSSALDYLEQGSKGGGENKGGVKDLIGSLNKFAMEFRM